MAAALALTLDRVSPLAAEQRLSPCRWRFAVALFADGGAFCFGMPLFGDILMGGDPAAVRRRLVLGEHDAAVARFTNTCAAFSRCQDVPAIRTRYRPENNPGVLAGVASILRRNGPVEQPGVMVVHLKWRVKQRLAMPLSTKPCDILSIAFTSL
jgi:hypothetical protein